MAAVAVTFARYFLELTNLQVADWKIAALALGSLTVINCLGVRAGGTVQSFLMVLKIAAEALSLEKSAALFRALLDGGKSN